MLPAPFRCAVQWPEFSRWSAAIAAKPAPIDQGQSLHPEVPLAAAKDLPEAERHHLVKDRLEAGLAAAMGLREAGLAAAMGLREAGLAAAMGLREAGLAAAMGLREADREADREAWVDLGTDLPRVERRWVPSDLAAYFLREGLAVVGTHI